MTEPNNLADKTVNGLEIEKLVGDGELTYLEAVIQFMEENSIDIAKFQKYIPKAIIDKLTQECLDNNMVRPSFRKKSTQTTLDFLM